MFRLVPRRLHFYIIQNFLFFHVSNISVLNFRFFSPHVSGMGRGAVKPDDGCSGGRFRSVAWRSPPDRKEWQTADSRPQTVAGRKTLSGWGEWGRDAFHREVQDVACLTIIGVGGGGGGVEEPRKVWGARGVTPRGCGQDQILVMAEKERQQRLLSQFESNVLESEKVNDKPLLSMSYQRLHFSTTDTRRVWGRCCRLIATFTRIRKAWAEEGGWAAEIAAERVGESGRECGENGGRGIGTDETRAAGRDSGWWMDRPGGNKGHRRLPIAPRLPSLHQRRSNGQTRQRLGNWHRTVNGKLASEWWVQSLKTSISRAGYCSIEEAAGTK